ncbi:RT0821/Lpp0805 family surface protein [Hoeflea sp.]|uniref:RT0821/Lpp0805 family surface protein n=1 Tax=Hoeflea sp. TaxID=1940281 RepID=UPI0037495757
MASDLTEAVRGEKGRIAHRALLALSLSCALFAAGCMSSKSDAVSALSIDPLTTSAVPPLSAEAEIMSDETVVRDLASGLGTSELGGAHPWTNALTGSAGVITDIAKVRDGSRSCRQFQTTRHAFDGVALFDGKVCQRPDTGWDLVTFERTGN